MNASGNASALRQKQARPAVPPFVANETFPVDNAGKSFVDAPGRRIRIAASRQRGISAQ